MAQYAYPVSDIDNSGSWTTYPTGQSLYTQLDETTADGVSTYIQKSGTPGGYSCTVGLTSLTDPQSSSNHVFNFESWIESGGVAFTIDLYCGTTLIKSNSSGSATTPTTYQVTLSASEADSITDYTALRVKMTNSNSKKNCRVGWIRMDVPDAPTTYTGSATVSATSSATSVGQVTRHSSTTVSATSGLSVTPTVTGDLFGSAAISASSGLAASGKLVWLIPVEISATSRMDAACVVELQSSASINASSAVTADGVIYIGGAATITVASEVLADGVLDLFGEAEIIVLSGMDAAGVVEIAIPAEIVSESGMYARCRVSGRKYILGRITLEGDLAILGQLITGGDRIRFHRNGDLTVGSIAYDSDGFRVDGTTLHVRSLEEGVELGWVI